jgi:hypothetical protein
MSISTVHPNTVLETIKQTPKSYFNSAFAGILKPLVGAMRNAVHFDFGDTAPEREHYDFAVEMFERGLFTLPFPFTAFGFRVPMNGKKIPGMILLSYTEEKLWGFACNAVPDESGRLIGAIPTICSTGTFIRKASIPGSADVISTSYPLVADDVARKMWGHDFMTSSIIDRRISDMIARAMAFTVMLMSKGVSTTHLPTPVKLNEARTKKGKPSIGERYTVKIDIKGLRQIAEDGGTETDITGFTRKSPRAHWRRGHFRTLNTGQVIPIVPSMINADSTFGAVKPKSYTV